VFSIVSFNIHNRIYLAGRLFALFAAIAAAISAASSFTAHARPNVAGKGAGGEDAAADSTERWADAA